MNALGLAVPASLFETFDKAIETATILSTAVSALGKRATISELINATIGIEKLYVVGAMGAAYYTGAVIGSIAIASQRSLTCGSQLSDLFLFIHQHKLQFKDWKIFYIENPEVINSTYPVRNSFFLKAKNSTVK